jgi:hypothetical protein
VGRTLFAGLLLLSAAVVPMFRGGSPVQAAAVQCDTPAIHSGSAGGVTWSHYVDVWADAACSGGRYVAYDFYYLTNVTIDDIFVDFQRSWICGVGPYTGLANAHHYQKHSVNTWFTWAWYNSNCVAQADSQVQFVESSVSLSVWDYYEVD